MRPFCTTEACMFLCSLNCACAVATTLVLIQHTSNEDHQRVCMRGVTGLLRRIRARFKRSNSSLRRVLCVSEQTQIAQRKFKADKRCGWRVKAASGKLDAPGRRQRCAVAAAGVDAAAAISFRHQAVRWSRCAESECDLNGDKHL